jgi:Cu+-exporting ATPase
LGIAGFGFGNVMLLALPGYLGLDSVSAGWFKVLAGWLGLALALPVLVYSAADFWRAAWLSLKQRVLTLDVPIALGLAAIYGQSVFEVASGRGAGYCDSLTGLIFFLLCGRLFQRKTFDRLAFDRDYKGFFPLAVTRKTSEQREESVSISRLAVGDRLLIRHGELLPADARLVSGHALVDYSFVTGEAEPLARGTGEHLYAGGRQVGGAIEVETVKPVSESYLTSLWNHEAFRKQRDDDTHSLTNCYSRRFTTIVVGVAIAAGAFWIFADATVAMKAFTSVLIVACPCALALAAPLTLGMAQRELGRRNVFLRNSQVIEQLAVVDTVVFDKTGTLTSSGSGCLIWTGAPLMDAEKDWLCSVAAHSAHPLARRVSEAIRGTTTDLVHAFVETTGCGMEGRVAGREIWMGSEAWMESRGAFGVRRQAKRDAALNAEEGKVASEEKAPSPLRSAGAVQMGSVVHVAFDGQYRGCFILAGVLRPEMDALITRLRGSCQLVLLSGDHARDAGRFRALLGGEARVEFNQSPFDKLHVIRELQASGRRVMMVGDGLNDAGALQQADVGVAVVERSGTFSPASDVILDAAQLPRLPEVLNFARRSVTVVRTCFVVSGLYNVAGVSIAAVGLLSPLVCAVLMPLSSATVVLLAIGATRWVARRTCDDGAIRRRRARTHRAERASLFALAVTKEALP